MNRDASTMQSMTKYIHRLTYRSGNTSDTDVAASEPKPERYNAAFMKAFYGTTHVVKAQLVKVTEEVVAEVQWGDIDE